VYEWRSTYATAVVIPYCAYSPDGVNIQYFPPGQNGTDQLYPASGGTGVSGNLAAGYWLCALDPYKDGVAGTRCLSNVVYVSVP